MNTNTRFGNDSIDPATTISINEPTTDDSRHRVLLERELGDRTFAVIWDTAIGSRTATELYAIAERRDEEYHVRTRFRLVDLRVSPVAPPQPRNLVEVPQIDVAKELRHLVHSYPEDLTAVHPGGIVIEHPNQGSYSAHIDNDGMHVSHPTPDSDDEEVIP